MTDTPVTPLTPSAAPTPPQAPALTAKPRTMSIFGTPKKKQSAPSALPSSDAMAPQAVRGAYGAKKKRFKDILGSINNIGLGKEKTHFIENLAILLNSGLPVIDALRTIEMEIRVKPMKKILTQIIEEVESGIALWRAMDNRNFFSAYALALIRIGEEAGSLSKNMEYLSIQQEKDHALKSKVKMAMIYPSIVLVMTLVITLGLAWFVLPQLVNVLISLNAKLPLVTRIVIWVANYFQKNGAVAVPSVFGGLLLLFILCTKTRLRGFTQRVVFRFPGIGTMARCATIAQFGVVLGSLLKAGVPMLESIRSMAAVTDTVAYRHFYERLASQIEEGKSFSSAFSTLRESRSLLPISVQQLIITGERSGKVTEMLMRVADIYEKKAEEAAQRLPVVLEPMLLLFMGGLVGTIAFAIIVPIYSVVGSVGR